MKKTYIAPEVEITRFNTEDIMNGSVVEVNKSDYSAATHTVDVNYGDLFKN